MGCWRRAALSPPPTALAFRARALPVVGAGLAGSAAIGVAVAGASWTIAVRISGLAAVATLLVRACDVPARRAAATAPTGLADQPEAIGTPDYDAARHGARRRCGTCGRHSGKAPGRAAGRNDSAVAFGAQHVFDSTVSLDLSL
ncbi:exported hypothetical protein [Frankia sp. AiPs1]|uniref:hypothetical protein n=1 Tax=Frankia sp. AiPa1 TaxID=573492 RepID=UPI00202B21DD|nr:hypothetical protein [Frankia sp. AiPa1]MCL9760296.1 hypothetical protein [Frankia sp. AiPa1]